MGVQRRRTYLLLLLASTAALGRLSWSSGRLGILLGSLGEKRNGRRRDVRNAEAEAKTTRTQAEGGKKEERQKLTMEA
jgi:hypothetical protein